jgi:hypothetical protein
MEKGDPCDYLLYALQLWFGAEKEGSNGGLLREEEQGEGLICRLEKGARSSDQIPPLTSTKTKSPLCVAPSHR